MSAREVLITNTDKTTHRVPLRDGATVQVVATGTDSPAPGYQSEIAQALTGGWMQTDANGNLVNRDGSVFTKATVGTLKDLYDDEQTLLDDAARINYTRELIVDGRRRIQGQLPATRYGSIPNDQPNGGKLKLMGGEVNAPPVVTLPPMPTDAPINIQLAFPKQGIVKVYTSGWGNGPLNARILVPAGWGNKPFAVKIAEAPLTTVTKRGCVVSINDQTVLDESAGPTTSPTYRFGEGGTAVPDAGVVDLALTNPGLPAGTTADVMLELTALG